MPDVTFSFTAGQIARLQHAVGVEMGLTDENGAPRDATAAETKAYVIRLLRNRVHITEKQEQEQAITVTPFDPS